MKAQATDLAASQGIGIPSGVVLVWILETFVLADPVPAVVAVALGNMIGGVIQFAKRKWFDEKLTDISRDLDR